MIYQLLKILLFAIGFSGYLSGLHLLFRSISEEIRWTEILSPIESPFKFSFWLYSPLIIILFWYLSDLSSNARFIFTIFSTIIYTAYAILSAIYFNYLKRLLKAYFIKKNSVFTYLSLLLVIGYGALCINSSAAFVKACFYQVGNREYKFDKQISKQISQDSTLKVQVINNEIDCCELLLDKVQKIPTPKLNIKRSFFSKIRGKYEVELDPKSNLKIYYYEKKGGKEYIPNYGVKLSVDNCALYIKLGDGDGVEELDKEVIEKNIAIRIRGYESTIHSFETKPATPFLFAFAKFCSSLGLPGYSIVGINEDALDTDFYLLWSFNIFLSGIIFFLSIKVFPPEV